MKHVYRCVSRCGTLIVLVCSVAASAVSAEVSPQVLEAEQSRIEAIQKAMRAAVSVFGSGGKGGGSAVVITPDGYALTNYHVVKPVGDHMKCSLPDNRLYDAVIVGVDPTGDVALIQLLGRDDFPCAELGDSDQVRVGDWCFAVGNPFLLATDFQPTVTYGIVSGVHRYQYPAGTLLEYADCIQTDASINPGNSGGPLFNAQGQLIGVNGRGSFEKRGRVNVGVGYAISINQIKNFMGYLRSGRVVDHATLGASVSSDDEGRVIVSNILESSDAYRRGLRYGDELVAFGGRRISTPNGFKNALGIFPKGWRVPLSYRREGVRYDVLARLAGVHTNEELLSKIQGPRPIEPPPDAPPTPDRNKKKRPPTPRPAPAAKVEIPEHVAKLIERRRGYANYYFNRQNRERVWSAFTAHGDFNKLQATWQLEGELAAGGKVQITLGQEEVEAMFPRGPAKVDLTSDLGDQLGPAGSGGLLVALHLWKRLLTQGPGQFGDVYYQGTAPVAGQEPLCDVLIATHNVVESRFMFEPTSGLLVGMEMFPDTDVDPCEIYFDDYRPVDGRLLPHRLQIRYGDNDFGEVHWQQIQLPEASKSDA